MNKNLMALLLGLSLMASQVNAATTVWGSAHNITGDSDVSLTGTLFQASSLTDGSSPGTTVNGVTFVPWVMPGGGGSSTSGNLSLVGLSGLLGYNGYGNASPPFSTTLSSSYKNLLTYGNYTSGAAQMTLTISNLTIGNTYQFQWWANDSRGSYAGNNQFSSDGNGISLNQNTTYPAVGGIGQYGIGTFLADGISQSITLQGTVGTMQNAYQVRNLGIVSTPEPTRLMLMGLSLGALALRRRRSML